MSLLQAVLTGCLCLCPERQETPLQAIYDDGLDDFEIPGSPSLIIDKARKAGCYRFFNESRLYFRVFA